MPRDTLTRERIVRTAIELLDEEGLEGLNMRSLGDRLGSAATAVYWHVESKDNLVLLAGDAVWGEIELPEIDQADWETTAMRMASNVHDMLIRHPWLVQAFGSHLFYGRGKARHDDHLLAVYELGGFAGPDADQAMASVFMFVLGSALSEAAAASLRRRLKREGQNADDMIRAAIAQQTEIAMDFPRLRERIESVDDDKYISSPDKTFELGLRAIFDGLEQQRQQGNLGTMRPKNHTDGWFA
jgi:AcrR family transcriptional regulator